MHHVAMLPERRFAVPICVAPSFLQEEKRHMLDLLTRWPAEEKYNRMGMGEQMQMKPHMVIQDSVPEGHFLQKLEMALDRSFICPAEIRLRFWKPPATRLRGSRRPLPLVRDRIGSEADGQTDHVTP